MMNDKIKTRRDMLKATAVGSLAGLLTAINPVKLLSSSKREVQSKLKVKIHPLAIKRNNKDKS